MRKFIRTIVLIACGCIPAAAQSTAPTPRATPASTPVPILIPNPAAGSPVNRARNPMLARMPGAAEPHVLRQKAMQEYVLPLYRKPGGREVRALAPDPAVAARYGAVLARPDSGVFKLVPDAGCEVNDKVINASERCLEYQFPGAGNSFSFRTESYRMRHLSDLTYDSGSFLMPGIHMHGLMVDLGDVPLEQVSLQTPAVRYIVELRPTEDFEKALDMDKLANVGVTRDGLLYRRSLPVAAGHTYVSRSIAYQGRIMRAVHGTEYNEMDLDKRRDVVTAFKVAHLDPDGTATIVWTRLASTDSPKLKMPPDEKTEPLGAEPRTRP